MSFLWNNIPTLFDEADKPASQRPVLHKIWVLLFVCSSLTFLVLYALDVNHLQCPVSDYSTTCVSKPDFGADPTGSDKGFCNNLVTATCTGTDNRPDSYYQSFELTGSSLTACQQICPCVAPYCTNYPLFTPGSSPYIPGRSLVNFGPGVGVSTVTGSQTCMAFASALKDYRVAIGFKNAAMQACYVFVPNSPNHICDNYSPFWQQLTTDGFVSGTVPGIGSNSNVGIRFEYHRSEMICFLGTV